MIRTWTPESDKEPPQPMGTDYHTVKAWFQQCRDYKLIVDRQLEHIHKIYDNATKATQNLSGMPSAPGNGDKIGTAAVDIVEEQERYRQMVRQLTKLQAEATRRAYCLVVATECASAIVDFYVDGKTQDQIAEETGVSGADIVRKRINRGCKALAEIWAEFDPV